MATVYVFQESTFEAALESWIHQSLAAYPHQAERIHTTAKAMRDFMRSPAVRDHKMLMEVPEPRALPRVVGLD